MLILPIGHDESLRKLPWLTIGIMALCVVVQVRSCSVHPDEEAIEALRIEQRDLIADALPVAVLGPAGRHVPPVQLLAIPGMANSPVALQLLPSEDSSRLHHTAASDDPDDRPDAAETAVTLERMRRLTPSDVIIAATNLRRGLGISAEDPRRVRYLAIEAEIARMERRDPTRLLGYRPADGLSIKLLTYPFAHGGWLHLIGNLLFLWLVGCNLEDRWGRAPFAAFYLVGGAAAGAAFWIMHPGSETVLIGASGAIAAAMGGFVVNYYDAEIRFFYFWAMIPPRWGTFEARAMFAMPVWFAKDLLNAVMYEADGVQEVAYSAHVGGFLVGAAIALGLRLSGIEAKHLLPRASKGVEWAEDPDVLRALDLSGRGQHGEAIELLRRVLARLPRHASAAIEAMRSAIAGNDEAAAREFLDRAVQALWRDKRQVELADLGVQLDQKWPRLKWSEASLATVARAQQALGYLERAELGFHRLIDEFPDGLQAARVLNELADLLERVGQYSESRQWAQTLISRFPDHALTPAARERLARLEGKADRAAPERIAKNAIAAGGIDLPPE